MARGIKPINDDSETIGTETKRYKEIHVVKTITDEINATKIITPNGDVNEQIDDINKWIDDIIKDLPGIIVSSGSGWIKWSDGTLVQYGTSALSVVWTGNPSQSAAIFPLAFYSTNYTLIALHRGNYPLILAEYTPERTINRTTISMTRSSGEQGIAGWACNYIVIGRWKA